MDKLSSKEYPTPVTRREFVAYYLDCPECGDEFEGEIGLGEVIECTCGAWVKAVK